ncbi:peptidoglycan editing factor PgeF [Devosia ginsengisoli]|uniref:peptidoglycan editing factor PgeF n=1 Tax=Devosia ginsengisoli TaxID=400770 RepID=UPI0026EBB4B6|nr:peptidoglycan editing factor PgeF [Devosia ginsengisoli]MCR6670008.1 peptidoglycan editing factor PgeF [Devosia ginsengisoli]
MTQHYEQSADLADLGGVRHGFFGRKGGSSLGEFSENNMSIAVGDEPRAVDINRTGAAEALGFFRNQLFLLKQVHSNLVHRLDAYPTNDQPIEADAIVTRQPQLALGILTADCTPILLADREAGVVGAAHAGWRGAVDGIVGNTVAAMVALGADPARIAAAIGPTISGENYEVGPHFMDDFVKLRPDGWRHFSTHNGARAHFDLPGFVADELGRAGVVQVERVGGCTYGAPERYFSHRYATHQGGKTGRQIAIIGLV